MRSLKKRYGGDLVVEFLYATAYILSLNVCIFFHLFVFKACSPCCASCKHSIIVEVSYTPEHGSCLQLKENSILVEPDIPIYDLRQVLRQVGLPLEPQAPLLDQLQVRSPKGE